MTSTVQTRPLISMHPSATVQEAAQLMNDCSIACIGLLDADKHFTGILTERDVTAFVSSGLDPTTIFLVSPIRTGDPAGIAARDLMTSPALACRADAFFEEVAERLADDDISGMPVVDGQGFLVGVISERDLAHALGGPLVRLAVRRHSQGPSLQALSEIPRESRRIKDIMSTHVVTARPNTSVRELAALTVAHDIGRVPIVTAEGQLIGVVTRGDLLACLAGISTQHRSPHQVAVVIGTEDRSSRPSFDWDPSLGRTEWPSRRPSLAHH